MSYVINIGRQFGAGGLAIAKILSNKLGIKAYDKELLNMAAEEYGFDPQTLKKMDEKRHNSIFMGFLHSILSSGVNEYSDNIISNENIFKIQSETIEKIASKESCIFVGRCADYVLRDRENVCNVFLTAESTDRINRIAKRDNITLKEAEVLIEEEDRARSEYYNYYTFKTWGAAESYDLCINTSIHGLEKTADIIIDFFKLTPESK